MPCERRENSILRESVRNSEVCAKKSVSTCGNCPEIEVCPVVGVILANNPSAMKNLKGNYQE